MSLVLTLAGRLLPLYGVIAIGYLVGRRLDVQKETIARLLIYVLAPVVLFQGALTTPLTREYLSLPVLFYVLCCVIALLAYAAYGRIWRDAHRNILAFTAGSGNTGYFGLPVALAFFGEQALGTVTLSLLGFILYENTLGFYLTARGHSGVRESLRKVARLPTIYAFALGLVLNVAGVELSGQGAALAASFRGGYTVLGMMLIGIGIAGVRRAAVDARFLSAAFVTKFLVWPAVVVLVIVLDRGLVHLYSPETHRVLLLMAAVPLAANTVAVATELKTEPEKAALAVLLSTLLALVTIPLTLAAGATFW